jgi:predicted nucleic acid-binding protein
VTRRAAALRERVVLDSSCWLEYLADTPRADLYASAVERVEDLVVPVITVYEVVKKLARELGEDVAAEALALMRRGEVVAIDVELAAQAATLSLPLADSMIYATARRAGAMLWTQDAHFEPLAGVRYFGKAG